MITAYLRVSTARQHPENQREEILKYANRKGITIDKWVTDIISGKTDKNKRALGRMLKHLHPGDTLIVTEISRLSRSLHEIMTIMKYCVDNKIYIYSTKDGYTFDDSINSKVLSFAFGLAAEIEHKLISQRTKEAIAIKKAQGVIMGRKKGSGTKINIIRKKSDEILQMFYDFCSINEVSRKMEVSPTVIYKLANEDERIMKVLEERRNYKKKYHKIIKTIQQPVD